MLVVVIFIANYNLRKISLTAELDKTLKNQLID